VPNAEAKQVALISAFLSIPVSERIAGFTKIIYEAVKKVVTPAINSIINDCFCIS